MSIDCDASLEEISASTVIFLIFGFAPFLIIVTATHDWKVAFLFSFPGAVPIIEALWSLAALNKK